MFKSTQSLICTLLKRASSISVLISLAMGMTCSFSPSEGWMDALVSHLEVWMDASVSHLEGWMDALISHFQG